MTLGGLLVGIIKAIYLLIRALLISRLSLPAARPTPAENRVPGNEYARDAKYSSAFVGPTPD